MVRSAPWTNRERALVGATRPDCRAVLTQPFVAVKDLARMFDVSVMTIHRDLDELEVQGILRKVRGGATPQPSSIFESNARYRVTVARAEKQALAKFALTLIEPGHAVVVDDSTTGLTLAHTSGGDPADGIDQLPSGLAGVEEPSSTSIWWCSAATFFPGTTVSAGWSAQRRSPRCAPMSCSCPRWQSRRRRLSAQSGIGPREAGHDRGGGQARVAGRSLQIRRRGPASRGGATRLDLVVATKGSTSRARQLRDAGVPYQVVPLA